MGMLFWPNFGAVGSPQFDNKKNVTGHLFLETHDLPLFTLKPVQ
jgi:hypothetical protein